MNTQASVIFNYLKDSKATVRTMSDILGIAKVSARLSELKGQLIGTEYELKDRWINVNTRYGSGITKVKEYWIVKKVAA